MIQYQTYPAKRPVQAYQQTRVQPAYQNQKGQLVLRPAQASRPTAPQAVYSGQGYIQNGGGHALHEARVQAALSVSDDKQGFIGSQQAYAGAQTAYAGSQPTYQFQGAEFTDGSFEKELAQLISANQATELKTKPQTQTYQYIQQSQPKPTYVAATQSKPKQYTFARPAEVQIPKYIQSPGVSARAKTPVKQQQLQQLPQQYLIETTKPQQTVQQQPIKQYIYKPQRPQYIVSTEEPKYFDIQEYSQQDDKQNAMKIVPAPQLQRTPQIFNPAQAPQRQPEQVVPSYLQYYQAIKPQNEDFSSLNDVKLESYVPRFVSKPQVSTERPDDQTSYFAYQTQTKAEEPSRFSKYKAVKPQVTSQFASDDDSLIQSLLMQSLKKQREGLSGFATTKTASTQQKPQVAQYSTASPSHSSIFISKAVVPKKPSTVAPPVEAASTEEEIPTVRLPPPKNNKVYTQEEFQALVAAGYSVTPIPVVDDDDVKGAFSPAPENYPGHSKYQSYVSESADAQTYQKQPTESYVTVTQSPRIRKHRRPINRNPYNLQTDDTPSESQSKLSFASLQPAETINYGMRTKAKVRPAPVNQEAEEEA